jgi:diaminopimelate decarboxylase
MNFYDNALNFTNSLTRQKRLLVRLGFNPKSSNKISFAAKFGCTLETGKILLRKAAEMNLNVRGTAFHIGVGCNEYEIFAKAIKDCREMFDYGKSIGFKMGKWNLLNLLFFNFIKQIILIRCARHWRWFSWP